MEKIIAYLREKRKNKNIKRLKSKDFSLITNNCVGGAILHDLNLKFNTPFINLWLNTKDFIKLCYKTEYYLNQELVFIKESGIDYPVGMLDDIKVYFQHYPTEKDAKETWERRKKRLCYNNLFFLLVEKADCSYDDLSAFDALEQKNKVVLVHKKYPDIKSAVLIKGFEKVNEIRYDCTYYKNKLSLKKPIDAFDYVAWFNNGIKE